MAFAEPADPADPAVAVDEDVWRDAAAVVGAAVVVVVASVVVVVVVVASVALQSTEVSELAPAIAASVVVVSVVEMLAAAVPVWAATARPIPRVAKTPTLATAAPTRDRAAG